MTHDQILYLGLVIVGFLTFVGSLMWTTISSNLNPTGSAHGVSENEPPAANRPH